MWQVVCECCESSTVGHVCLYLLSLVLCGRIGKSACFGGGGKKEQTETKQKKINKKQKQNKQTNKKERKEKKKKKKKKKNPSVHRMN